MFYSSLPLNVQWTFLQKIYEIFVAAFIPSIPDLLATVNPLELILETHNLNWRRKTVLYTLEDVFIPSIINTYIVITEKQPSGIKNFCKLLSNCLCISNKFLQFFYRQLQNWARQNRKSSSLLTACISPINKHSLSGRGGTLSVALYSTCCYHF